MSATTVQLARQPELRLWQHGAVFLLAIAVIVSRRPDAVFHAQFYAEDGHAWYADAYNLGWWPALFRTWTGYFLTLPRLAAAFALLAPLYRVPLLLNLIAISIQALPANLLLSSRSSAWGSLRFRAALAGMYLVLPNCDEVSYGITDANFLLAMCALVLLLASTPQSTAWRLFDIAIVLLCGLSGPFCIFLLPVAVFLAFKRRDSWRWVPVGILAGCCLIQAWALLFLAPAARSNRALGASLQLFGRILGSQVYLGALLGSNALSAMPGRWLSIVLCCVAIGGTAFAIVCSFKSPLVMKLFLLFSAVLFVGALKAPVEWGRPELPVWDVLSASPGYRHWFFPTLAFAWSLLYGFRSRIVGVKIVSAALLCLMSLGILRDWRHHTFQETNLADSVKNFAAAPPGAVVTIQEQPEGWTMKLIKHGSTKQGPTKQGRN